MMKRQKKGEKRLFKTVSFLILPESLWGSLTFVLSSSVMMIHSNNWISPLKNSEQFEDLGVVSMCWYIIDVSMLNPAFPPVKIPESQLKLLEAGFTVLYRLFCLLQICAAVAKHVFYEMVLFFFVHTTPDLGCAHNVVTISCWDVYDTQGRKEKL